MEEEAPLCACGIAASTGISKKEGANFGKAFYGCGKFGTDQRLCRFFQWKKDAHPIIQTGRGPKKLVYLSEVMKPPQNHLQPEVAEEMAEVEERGEKKDKSEKELLQDVYREVKKMRKLLEVMSKK